MDNLEQLLQLLGSEDQVQVYKADRKLQVWVAEVGAPGRESDRQTVAAALLKALEVKDKKYDGRGNPTPASLRVTAARRRIAEFLSLVAGDAEVPKLKDLLADLDVADVVRQVLQRMSGAPAIAALIHGSVVTVDPDLRAGVLTALGYKRGPEVIETLKKSANDRDLSVRRAAIDALASQCDPSVDPVLAAAGKQAGGRMKRPISRARLRLADSLVAAGMKDDARKIYMAVLNDQPEEPQRKAAEQALRQLS